MTIKVACSGFPVGKSFYTTKLKTVELSRLFDVKPRRLTVEKWRREAADEFEFIVCASKIISHPIKSFQTHDHHRPHKVGGFQESAEVRNALETTVETARTLRSRIIFFRLPGAFSPHPDNVGRLQAFLGRLQRGAIKIAWEAPASWPLSLIETFSSRQDLIPAYNPLNDRFDKLKLPFRYYRLGKNGTTEGLAPYSDIDLRRIKARCQGAFTYVVFNNGPTSFQDAMRFNSLLVSSS